MDGWEKERIKLICGGTESKGQPRWRHLFLFYLPPINQSRHVVHYMKENKTFKNLHDPLITLTTLHVQCTKENKIFRNRIYANSVNPAVLGKPLFSECNSSPSATRRRMTFSSARFLTLEETTTLEKFCLSRSEQSTVVVLSNLMN
jgi:hypothetical protein